MRSPWVGVGMGGGSAHTESGKGIIKPMVAKGFESFTLSLLSPSLPHLIEWAVNTLLIYFRTPSGSI